MLVGLLVLAVLLLAVWHVHTARALDRLHARVEHQDLVLARTRAVFKAALRARAHSRTPLKERPPA